MESAPTEVSYLYIVKPGKWYQHKNGQIDIMFPGGAICVGHVQEVLDVSTPLKIILEAKLAKPSQPPIE